MVNVTRSSKQIINWFLVYSSTRMQCFVRSLQYVYCQLLKWLPTFSVFCGLPLPWPTWEDVESRYHLVHQHETFPVFFYSTSSSSFSFLEASPFVILRFWDAWSFLLHNRTLYVVDHMSLILIFSISITTAGRVLEVCYFTTTTITTDSSLHFAQSCRLKKFTEGLPLPCSCQCRCHLQYLFCTFPWHPHRSPLHYQKVPRPHCV